MKRTQPIKLLNAAHQTLVPRLEVADSTWSRMKGLLGRPGLAESEALWIPNCASVHTVMMKFTIDLIFLDREMAVVKTCSRVKPNRLWIGAWGADSVVELPEGFLEKNPVRLGEKLHVDHQVS